MTWWPEKLRKAFLSGPRSEAAETDVSANNLWWKKWLKGEKNVNLVSYLVVEPTHFPQFSGWKLKKKNEKTPPSKSEGLKPIITNQGLVTLGWFYGLTPPPF